MEKGKKSKKKVLYFLPFAIQLIIHFVATLINQRGGDNYLWRVIAATIMSVLSMALGEGYGSIAFIVAGFYDRFASYIAVIALSVISSVASLVGFMITGIEGFECLWMTLVFWIVDLFLFVFSIVRITKLSSKQTK